MKQFFQSKKFLAIMSFLGIYLLSSGVSWLIFSSNTSQPVNTTDPEAVGNARSRIDPNAPKTEACPINGMLLTAQERDIWEGRSPLLAVIENHLDSRPPSGVSRADVVYEAVAEGGITRFLNVFYCAVSDMDYRIGPVRSARVYFIKWAAEYGKNPLFLHVGGANNICNDCPGGVKPVGDIAKNVDAFALLNTLGWRGASGNALDGGTNVGYPVVWRDYERIPGAATEHTYMGSTDKLFEEAEKRGYGANNPKEVAWDSSFVSWKFTDSQPSSSPVASSISFEFWQNQADYDVTWQYDSQNNQYLRSNGGKPHVDMETSEQLNAKNIVVQFVKEQSGVDNEKHNYYENVGTGEALIFQNGDVIEGTWKKATISDRTRYFDEDGLEISFVRGKIWIEAVPAGNTINY